MRMMHERFVDLRSDPNIIDLLRKALIGRDRTIHPEIANFLMSSVDGKVLSIAYDKASLIFTVQTEFGEVDFSIEYLVRAIDAYKCQPEEGP